MKIEMSPLARLEIALCIPAFIRACLTGAGAALLFSGCASTRPAQVAAGTPKEDVLRLQIYLDSQNFGPGVVDGSLGEFTEKALSLYLSASGMSDGDSPDTSTIVPYASYTVTTEDLSVLGTMAVEPAEVAQQSKLPYTELVELLAERFHTTPSFLNRINPGTGINALEAGASVKVPNIQRPFRFDRFPSGYPAPSANLASSRRVSVDLDQRMLLVTQGGGVIAAFPITPGSSEHPAPRGEWKVARAVPWPWYRYDEGVLKRGERTEDFHNFPPGPNSPVGVLWAGLNRPGVGIHGTSTPDTIGRSGSHGCIRLSNWDAAKFYTLIAAGTPVTIQ